MPIVLELLEEDEGGNVARVIGDAEFSARISRPDKAVDVLDRFYDDGTHGSVRAGQGQFTRLYANTDLPGEYEIVVRGSKGVVPVEQLARVEVAAFPQLVVLEPAARVVTTLDGRIALRGRLTGGSPAVLDRGRVVAQVTTPSGSTEEIGLDPVDDVYVGVLTVREDGEYRVLLTTRDAMYKGVPYAPRVATVFEARVTPTADVQPRVVDLGRREVGDLRRGVELPLSVRSTSAKRETLSVALEGMPGYSLAGAGTISVQGAGATSVPLRLVGDQSISPGIAQGVIVVRPTGRLNVEGGNIPVSVEAFQPVLRISPASIDLGSPASCSSWSAKVPLAVKSSSDNAEDVELQLSPTVLGLREAKKRVPVGDSTMSLEFDQPAVLQDGRHDAALTLKGRDDVAFQLGDRAPTPGTASVPLAFAIEPLVTRCGGRIAGGVGLLALLGVLGTMLWRSFISPPILRGILRWRDHMASGESSAAGSEVKEIPLDDFRKTEIRLGEGGSIPSGGSGAAVLAARKLPHGQVGIYLRPEKEVTQDGKQSFGVDQVQIEHAGTWFIGQREFQYDDGGTHEDGKNQGLWGQAGGGTR